MANMATHDLVMTNEQFDYFRQLANTHAGIALADHKKLMVKRRVSKRVRALGMRSLEEYRDLLCSPAGALEVPRFVNALTTNKTSFFREDHHFSHLRDIAIPALLSRSGYDRVQRLRIWSAGCSSGQEPYSIAMIVDRTVGRKEHVDARILATDIDTDIIDYASRGVYSQHEALDVPVALRRRYLAATDRTREWYVVAPELRHRVAFKPLNLHGPWPMRSAFDAIFCRNVVIYFSKEDQRILFDRFADVLNPGGYLYIGHSESLYQITDRFRLIGQNIYQKVSECTND